MATAAIIVTGLPASGKTTLARRLAAALGWPMLDKDDFLEQLYATVDVTSMNIRRRLSREADAAFQLRARQLPKAVLVSHWRPNGDQSTSGTQAGWVLDHFTTTLELHCDCPWQTALERFRSRSRHPGHLDAQRSQDALTVQFQALAQAYPLGLCPHISVPTGTQVDTNAILGQIRQFLAL